MILATGKKPSDPRQTGAFSLIELILVMALLVVVVSMVVPKMSGFVRGRALDSEVRRFQALAHAGQSRAVSEGMPMMLWIDTKAGAYGLEEETPAASTGDPKAEVVDLADSLEMTVQNEAGTAPTMFRKLPAIRFMADGSIDEDSPHVIVVTDTGGVSLWLVELKNRSGYEIRDTGN